MAGRGNIKLTCLYSLTDEEERREAVNEDDNDSDDQRMVIDEDAVPEESGDGQRMVSDEDAVPEESGDDEEEEGSEEGDEEGDEEEGDEGEWDSDDDDEDEDEDSRDIEGATPPLSSDGEGEQCPICLSRFRDQDVGTPESCDHDFCLECILEWSKNVNTCPVDRQVYNLVLARHPGEQKIFKKIPVQDAHIPDDEEDDVTYCEECGQCDREDRLLLCDGCDLGYHCECLTPPLQHVPVDEWFCEACSARQASSEGTDERGVSTLSEDSESEVAGLRTRRRQIARTRAFERVRAVIMETRAQRSRNVRRLVSSSDEDVEVVSVSMETPTTSSKKVATKKKAVRKKTTKKTGKKKSTKGKKRKTKKKTTKGGKRKKGRRKKKSRKATVEEQNPPVELPPIVSETTSSVPTNQSEYSEKAANVGAFFDLRFSQDSEGVRFVEIDQALKRLKKTVPQTTVKARIAERLGLSKPPVGRTIPVKKAAVEKNLETRKSDAGIASLSILGSRDDLIGFNSDDDLDQPSTSSGVRPGVGRHSKYSQSSLRSHQPVGKSRIKRSDTLDFSTAEKTGFDLLGSIMLGQDRLNTLSRDVTINRDGSLTSKRSMESDETGAVVPDITNHSSPVIGGESRDGFSSSPVISPVIGGESRDGFSSDNEQDLIEKAEQIQKALDIENRKIKENERKRFHSSSTAKRGESSPNGYQQENLDVESELYEEILQIKPPSTSKRRSSDHERPRRSKNDTVSTNKEKRSKTRTSDAHGEDRTDTKKARHVQKDSGSFKVKFKIAGRDLLCDTNTLLNKKDGKKSDFALYSSEEEDFFKSDNKIGGSLNLSFSKSEGSDSDDPFFDNRPKLPISSLPRIPKKNQSIPISKSTPPESIEIKTIMNPSESKSSSKKSSNREQEKKGLNKEKNSKKEVLHGKQDQVKNAKRDEEEPEKRTVSLRDKMISVTDSRNVVLGSKELSITTEFKEDITTRREYHKANKPETKSDRKKAMSREKRQSRDSKEGSAGSSRRRESRKQESGRKAETNRDREKKDERSRDRERKGERSRDRNRTEERSKTIFRTDERVREYDRSEARSRHKEGKERDRRRKSRSTSRERSKRKRRKSRSWSRDEMYEKDYSSSRKYKKQDRNRSRERSSERKYRNSGSHSHSPSRRGSRHRSDREYRHRDDRRYAEESDSSRRLHSVDRYHKDYKSDDAESDTSEVIFMDWQRVEEGPRMQAEVVIIDDDDDDVDVADDHAVQDDVARSTDSALIPLPGEIEKETSSENSNRGMDPGEHVEENGSVSSGSHSNGPPSESPEPQFDTDKRDTPDANIDDVDKKEKETSGPPRDVYDPEHPTETESLHTESSPDAEPAAHYNLEVDNEVSMDEDLPDPEEGLNIVMAIPVGQIQCPEFSPSDEPPLHDVLQGPNMNIPMNFSTLPPGYQPMGLPPRQMLMRPVIINRPPPFGNIARIPRLDWPMGGPGSLLRMPDHFRPADPSIMNGGFDHPPQDFRGVRPGFIPQLIGQDMSMMPPNFAAVHQLHNVGEFLPAPGSHPGLVGPSSNLQPMATGSRNRSHSPTNAVKNLDSKAARDSGKISKLLNVQAQLAVLKKMINSNSKTDDSNEENTPPLRSSKPTFKIPLPPMSSESSSHSTSRHKRHSHRNIENMNVIDMDVVSPLDDEGDIVLPLSPDQVRRASRKKKKRQGKEVDLMDDVPGSAVELSSQDKYLNKVHLQERVIEEVKLSVKPFYADKTITKEEYKDILRRAVPKICHSKHPEVNPLKIKNLVEKYVSRMVKEREWKARKPSKHHRESVPAVR